MTELYPVFFATAVFVILSGLEILFVKLLNKRWWQKRWIRRGSYLLPVCGMVSIAIWTFGIFSFKKTIMIIGSAMAAITLVLIFALLLSLPISGVFNIIHDWIEKRSKRNEKESDAKDKGETNSVESLPRRRFLKAAAALAPVVYVSAGVSGVAHAFTGVEVYRKPIYFNNLPPELEGFKILHLSDIHIGYYIWLDHIEELLKKAKRFEPDILLATGDLSDRIDVYGNLLGLFAQFKAPLGAYGSIGNHEYFRGFTEVVRIFGRSQVPLLLSEGVSLSHNGYPIYLAGADDPKYLSRRGDRFFERTVDKATKSAPSDAFTILMSHRPECFDYASSQGIDLTLGGHHHGTQIGFGGRSALETVLPTKYLWGVYRKGESRLYTSSGVGHWFPFRLGCPAEAPILELRTGNGS